MQACNRRIPKTMTLKVEKAETCFAWHAAQLPVIGREGQEKLRKAHIHISGTGRIGTWIAIDLAAAGAVHLSANDPQILEPENIGSFVFARLPDLGKQKVYVLEAFFHGRPDLVFEAVWAPTESRRVDPYIERCDLVISCANTIEGRLAAERKAIRYTKPVMQVAAFDGRERLGGLVTLRLPENRWCACFGCYLGEGRSFPRGEGLLSTVTSTLAAIAANMAVQIITGVRSDFLKSHDLFLIDLESYVIQTLAIERRKGCEVCGGR